MKKFLFLDRDGTLIVNKHYLSDPTDVEFCENAIRGLKLLQDDGYKIVVVTNQSGVGRGYFQKSDVLAVHAEIRKRLENEGVHIAAFHYCPHAPDENCNCRKPKSGMIKEYLNDTRTDLTQSWFIGDRLCDVQTGINANVKSVWLRNQRLKKEEQDLAHELATAVAKNWAEIEKIVMRKNKC
jgi:D-glycero-D-manno-heptose 1,7-bisphosphate phosphatase